MVVAYEQGGVLGLLQTLRSDVLNQPSEMMKISVPSLVYTVQNNLLYFALSHLNAATYMVCYQVFLSDQLKINNQLSFSTVENIDHSFIFYINAGETRLSFAVSLVNLIVISNCQY